MSNQPISTQWPFDTNINVQGTTVVPSVVLVINQAAGLKGTGWLVSDQHIVTNEHVIRDIQAPTNILVVFPDGNRFSPSNVYHDNLTDIAALEFSNSFSAQPLQINTQNLEVGSQIYAWGHPLGYDGPAPILSVGYLAGRNLWQPNGMQLPQHRLVLNAALNPGNSGGPIFPWGDNSVCGVAVTKHAPISQFLQSAIVALANNTSGVVFTSSDGQGNQTDFVESQIVAEILIYFQNMTQVVIGEAIMPIDITNFLDLHGIPWSQANPKREFGSSQRARFRFPRISLRRSRTRQ